MDLIIFSGQSNMQGQSECLLENEIVADAYEYRFLTDETVPLRDPVGENITYALRKGYEVIQRVNTKSWLEDHVVGGACYGNSTLVPSFARTYTKLTGRKMLAVHVAKGSTKISEWLPGTPGYDIISKKSLAAIKKAEPKLIYFVWLQGESDAIASNTKENYKKSLKILCDSLKRDIGIKRFGIIRVGRFTNDERDLEIISAQDEICREDEDFVMLTDISTELNTQSEYMNPNVKGHYSARGLQLLGEKAAETLSEIN